MVTIREIEDKDILPVAEFLPQGFAYQRSVKETWLQRFENWWTLNPAFTSKFPRGWILEKDARIVGFIGNIPVKFLVRGEEKIAAASAAWYVDPSIRGIFTLKLFNEYLNQKTATLFLFTTNKTEIMNILFKFGFKEYFLQSSPSEYLYFINRRMVFNRETIGFILSNYFLKERITNGRGFLEFLKRVGTFTYSYLFQVPLIQIRDLTGETYTTSFCTYCDDSFSRLWEPFTNADSTTLSRDKNTLNWLYFVAGRRYNRIVIQCRRSSDNSLAGYMVFDFLTRDMSKGGIMRLVDVCIINNDYQILTSLISFAIEISKQKKAPLLILRANNLEIDNFLHTRCKVRWTTQYHSFVRFSDPPVLNSDSLKVYGSLIDPPRGIDH